MVDTNSDDLFSRLRKLSKREIQVLVLRCQGMKYVAIGKALYIAVSTVKEDMSRIYMKLGLDVLEPSERLKVLYDTICPFLKSQKLAGEAAESKPEEVVDGEVMPEEEEKPIPKQIMDMVESDGRAIVPWVPAGPLVAPPKPPSRRRNWPVVLGFGVVLGICLGAVAVYLFLRPGNGPIPFIPQPTPTVPTPTAVSSNTSLPSPTQEISTQTPLVIIVTATPPPATGVPTLTPVPQPATLFTDNFDQGLSGSWSVVSGNPVVVNGQLTSDQDTWIKIGDSSWSYYTVELDSSITGCWFSGPWSAIAVRVQDMDNMIAFKWAACDTEWDNIKNGNWVSVPNSHGNTPNAENFHISVTVKGGQFVVDINGQRVSSFFNSDYKQGGVAIKIGPKFLLDNIKISTIQP